MATNLPLTSLYTNLQHNINNPYCFRQGFPITRKQLLNHALSLSKQMPEKRYAVNLCQDRYLFTVSYLAAIVNGQISLLPPYQTHSAINDLIRDYDNSYCISDKDHKFANEQFFVEYQMLDDCNAYFPQINTNQTISISYTSGSTGAPQACKKTWREFQHAASLAIKQCGLQQQALNIISTVPPQHMYGLETSIFWPLFSALSISNCRPFFPEDIRRACNASDRPVLLISTPTHIRACLRTGLNWDNVKLILSSTSYLPIDLAKLAEQHFGAPLLEIFGSTETLSYASRRATENEQWIPYQGIELSQEDNNTIVRGAHLSEPVLTGDQFLLAENGRFTVLGRSSDLIKVAGKRASLSELNRILNIIDGVEEGVFFTTQRERLGALVVTKLSKEKILRELKGSIDEVFLPRPLKIVDILPRNEIGKIVRSKLDHYIKELNIA